MIYNFYLPLCCHILFSSILPKSTFIKLYLLLDSISNLFQDNFQSYMLLYHLTKINHSKPHVINKFVTHRRESLTQTQLPNKTRRKLIGASLRDSDIYWVLRVGIWETFIFYAPTFEYVVQRNIYYIKFI